MKVKDAIKDLKQRIKSELFDVKELIDPLQNDLEMQFEGLRGNDRDVRWDCYDSRNWEVMINNCKDIKRTVKEIEKLLREL